MKDTGEEESFGEQRTVFMVTAAATDLLLVLWVIFILFKPTLDSSLYNVHTE